MIRNVISGSVDVPWTICQMGFFFYHFINFNNSYTVCTEQIDNFSKNYELYI